MASKFSLQAILSLTDNITAPYKKTTNGITAMNKKLISGFKKVATVGFGAVVAGTGLATREFIRLDEAVTNAGAKFKDLVPGTENYNKTLKKLSDAARQVGKDTEFSAVDAAGALDKMAMAGLNSSQSMALLRGTTDLATAANTDLTTAVDIATDSLGAFNLVTEDTAQLQKNLSRISDVMAKTTTTANTSLTEMFESVKAGAPAFTAAGQQLEDFAALTGVMANAGVKGQTSGTNLRNIMLKLAKPTAEAAGVLASLGVVTQDANGDFRNIIDILGDFEKGLVGMGTQQKTAALATIFGAKAVTGVNILLAEGSTKLAEYRDSLIDSAGASRTMAEAMRNSIGNRLKVLKSGLTELGLQFIDAFDEQGTKALDRIINIIQNFDMKPVIQQVVRMAKFMKQAFVVIKKVVDNLTPTFIAFFDTLKRIADLLIPIIIPAIKFLGDVIVFLLPIVNAVVSAVTGLFESMRDTGIIDRLSVAFGRIAKRLQPLKAVVIDMIGFIKKMLVETGALNILVTVFNAIAAAIGLASGAMRLLWTVAKPILFLMFKLLQPILFIITKIIDAMSFVTGAVGDFLGFVGDKLGGRSNNIVTEQQLQPEPIINNMPVEVQQAIQREQAQRDRETKQRYDINLNAPAGYSMGMAGETPSSSVALGGQ